MQTGNNTFHNLINAEFCDLISSNAKLFDERDVFRMDLHCHDYNSNVPDEILGRILNVPETWLPTEKLITTLSNHGMDAFTITNHNNARSCYEQLDKGNDILVGAEFSCLVPDYQVGIHVLTYGFNPAQEVYLNRYRRNLYAFIDYTRANNLPTIWAHPLYHYQKTSSPPMEFFNKMALVFERFEVLNGQRDTWQNMLVKKWIGSLTPEKIERISDELGLRPDQYCRDPYRKFMSGGSDSHMGIFSGLTGVRLYVPDLAEKRKTAPLSVLALEAIRDGRMAAFGGQNNSEKMMVTFLDYVCQIALHSQDPGLLRILLHKGQINQKITAVLVANGFAELRQHKVTMSFIKAFHESLTGTRPHFTKRWLAPPPFKPIFDEVSNMAKIFKMNPANASQAYARSIGVIYQMLAEILDKRLTQKIENIRKKGQSGKIDINKLISTLEAPSILRSYLTRPDKASQPKKSDQSPDLAGFLDGLSFPFLASSVILSAHFTSAKVLYNTRPMLADFAKELGCLEHPKRMLWLSDTWNDKNGVSSVLKSMLAEIQRRNLPIDIMICSNNTAEEEHLIVIRPQSELDIPFYHDQKIRIPDFLQIHHKFHEGEYDRIMCSTEGVMGLAALYLKKAYSVPAYFYLHSDWKTFTKKVLDFNAENQGRFIRLIRAFYKEFDSIFVLNSNHYKWLSDKKMAMSTSKIFKTAHWPGKQFIPLAPAKRRLFNLGEVPVLLYAGRLSLEKGVMDIPEVFQAIKKTIPNIRMVFAGSGPAEDSLRTALPDAIYLGWVDPEVLPEVYSSADLLILPSWFDTFSCVVIEAMSCGLPVIAYNTMGPKDIIRDGIDGFLVSGQEEMINKIKSFFFDLAIQSDMSAAALKRSKDYQSDLIISDLLLNTGLSVPAEVTSEICIPC